MTKVNNDPVKIKQLLTRNVEQVFVAKHLKNRLLKGERLRVKLGFDPTGPKLHLGRAVTLWKLREFQELGHQIVLIIGDFTALVGDPSDKLAKRPLLTVDQVRTNLKDYKKQLGLILDLNQVEWRYNSEWLQAMTFMEVARLAESFSVQQMLARRNFKERYSKGVEISLREFLYPLMQGFDSAAVRSDVEVGGTDQLFNLHAGRVVQELYKQPPQDIITFSMLEGTDGRKMSTSWGNVINIIDSPLEMYGKVMSLTDKLIIKYFQLATQVADEEIKAIEKSLKQVANPRDSKARLAYEIVALYHSVTQARQVAKEFDLIHRSKETPQHLPKGKIPIGTKSLSVIELLVLLKLATSKGEARRLLVQGGVKINKVKVSDWQKIINPKPGMIIQVGSRRFVELA
ncbi:MAG: tyrosine--tRNA ligase [Patescibacteria group bacterium]